MTASEEAPEAWERHEWGRLLPVRRSRPPISLVGGNRSSAFGSESYSCVLAPSFPMRPEGESPARGIPSRQFIPAESRRAVHFVWRRRCAHIERLVRVGR